HPAGGWPEAALRVVKPAQHGGDRRQRLIGHPVRRQRVLAALAFHVRQDLAAAVVEPDHPGCPREADLLQVAQQGVHRRRPRSGVAPHRVGDPDHRADVAADQRHLFGSRGVRPGHERCVPSPSRASTYWSGSKGARSSGPSPNPTSFTGIPSLRCTARMIPPLAVPSSLVNTTPVTLTTSVKTRACDRPFWPVVASSTSNVSVTGPCRSMTRLTLPSSSMSPTLVCRRPAVSTTTVSTPSSIPRRTASNATLAGSAPSGPRTTSAPTRPAQVASWSAAAARNVSAAPSRTLWPSAMRTRAIFPQVVVLPDPLTPTTRITAAL